MRKHAPSSIVIAAWLSSNVAEGCAVMSSGDCVEKDTCTGSETPVGPETGEPAAVGGELVEETPGAVEIGEDVASTGMATEEDPGEGSVSEVDAVGSDVGLEDALTQRDATTDAASEEIETDAPAYDSDQADTTQLDGAMSVDSAAEGSGEDAADDGSTCAPSLCTNTCVPYFVPCCKPAGGCGCSLLFPPGPCL